jgi:hypothetical protein
VCVCVCVCVYLCMRASGDVHVAGPGREEGEGE